MTDFTNKYCIKKILSLILSALFLFFSASSHSNIDYSKYIDNHTKKISKIFYQNKKQKSTDDYINQLEKLEDSFNHLKTASFDITLPYSNQRNFSQLKTAIKNACNEANKAIHRVHNKLNIIRNGNAGKKPFFQKATLLFKQAIIQYSVAEPCLLQVIADLEEKLRESPQQQKHCSSGSSVSPEQAAIMHAISATTLLSSSKKPYEDTEFIWIKENCQRHTEPLLKVKFDDFVSANQALATDSSAYDQHTNFESEETYLFYLALSHFMAIPDLYPETQPRPLLIQRMNKFSLEASTAIASEITNKRAFDAKFKKASTEWKAKMTALGYVYDSSKKAITKHRQYMMTQ